MDGQKRRFVAGDEVTIKRSTFTYGNKYGLIAQAVSRGSDTVVFRSAKGKPAWSETAQARAGAPVEHS